ncbi:hypothetical protein [Streptomyces spectabilis]|uniref:Uncharacterized protein n=1 Tax=Streptomyces spectabilis TaxID=68270 RepID=A0A7W8ASK5_STRST|nr:hypothetical protein [Streptomyces spectabilis]MBB5102605.1 hypothetical protein [Streptomyces spectabilis]MCI3907644.1 hypothetical protein [Streptomyces spectabilis]
MTTIGFMKAKSLPGDQAGEMVSGRQICDTAVTFVHVSGVVDLYAPVRLGTCRSAKLPVRAACSAQWTGMCAIGPA